MLRRLTRTLLMILPLLALSPSTARAQGISAAEEKAFVDGLLLATEAFAGPDCESVIRRLDSIDTSTLAAQMAKVKAKYPTMDTMPEAMKNAMGSLDQFAKQAATMCAQDQAFMSKAKAFFDALKVQAPDGPELTGDAKVFVDEMNRLQQALSSQDCGVLAQNLKAFDPGKLKTSFKAMRTTYPSPKDAPPQVHAAMKNTMPKLMRARMSCKDNDAFTTALEPVLQAVR